MYLLCVIFLVLQFSVFLVNSNPPTREVRCDVESSFIACNLQTLETRFLSASVRECSPAGILLSCNSYSSLISPFLLGALYTIAYPEVILITFLNCDLTKLDSDLFEHQLQLRQIWAPNEQFHCDCDMQWTSIVSEFDWLITGNCLTPSNLNGKPITDNSNYQNCVQPHSYQCFNRSFICPANSTCINTMESAYCECNEGFFMFENKCHLNVDCTVNNGGCDHLCSITDGTDHCVCLLGYRLYENRRSCIDINECTEGLDTCDQICTNTNGSYECACDAGFSLGHAGSCSDIDECLSNNGDCDQICTNTNGSYECACDAGFSLGHAGSCSDIDECLFNNGNCDQICTNTNGSFYCSCTQGYSFDAEMESCMDVDECMLGIHTCHQSCFNTDGSYVCDCQQGLILSATGGCVDVDECLFNNGGCEYACTNTNGSFQCSCMEGYGLKDDGKSCEDIDECVDATNCRHDCVNTDGSYVCTCNIGYNITSEGECVDFNECLVNNGGCEQRCINSKGSYSCGSFPGSDSEQIILIFSIIACLVFLALCLILIICLILCLKYFRIQLKFPYHVFLTVCPNLLQSKLCF